MATKLRIGPLPRQRLVKVTLNMPADLLADLERYAAMHSQLHGEKVDAVTLAPHMLAWFLRNDRGFRGQR